MNIQPRLIRHRDAPAYLGMDRNRFNREVRPGLTEIPIGRQGVAFDRLDLDVWIDEYIQCNGRRPKASKLEDDICQKAIECQDYALKGASGTLKNVGNTVKADGSGKVQAHLAGQRRKST